MTASANNTTVTPNFLTDAAGGVWSIVPSPTAGGQVCYNGVIDTTTSNVIQLLYFGGVIWQQNAALAYYAYVNSAWSAPQTDPRKAPPVVAGGVSADNTLVTTVGPAIIDATLEKWTLVASAASGNQIACNGTVDTQTNNVVLLLFKNGLVFQSNSGGGWWSKAKNTDAWTYTSDPRPAVATPAGSAPAQAASAGFNTLTFGDEFTANSIQYQPNDSGAPSPVGMPKWYADAGSGANHSQVYVANNVLHFVNAANNSNSQGQLSTALYHSSIPRTVSSNTSHKQATGQGGIVFVYGYFEASMAFAFPGSGGGFPAFWSGSDGGPVDPRPGNEIDFMENGGGGLGVTVWEHTSDESNLNSSQRNSDGSWTHTQNNGQGINTGFTPNANTYHTYGCLWQGPPAGGSSGKGLITFFVDNKKVGNSVVTGAGTQFTACVAPFTPGIYGNGIVLGTGPGWNMTVDWVRIWQ